MICLIAVLGERNRVMGRNNGLPFSRRLKPDMNRFIRLTSGHPVIMGRKTWESIDEPYRPLKDRTNFVITSKQEAIFPGARTAHSVTSALEMAEYAEGSETIFVIGGALIYGIALPKADQLFLTLVNEEPIGDTYFPDYSAFSVEVERFVVPDFLPRLTFLTLERPPSSRQA